MNNWEHRFFVNWVEVKCALVYLRAMTKSGCQTCTKAVTNGMVFVMIADQTWKWMVIVYNGVALHLPPSLPTLFYAKSAVCRSNLCETLSLLIKFHLQFCQWKEEHTHTPPYASMAFCIATQKNFNVNISPFRTMYTNASYVSEIMHRRRSSSGDILLLFFFLFKCIVSVVSAPNVCTQLTK